MGELVNELTWSKSRDALFRECKRAYFFQCYGFWGGWQRDADPRVRELYIMKNLHTQATWVGSAVHALAERAIKAAARGLPVDPQESMDALEGRLRQDLEDSRTGRHRQDPKRIVGLQEHYYDQDPGEGVWEDAIALARQCAQVFFEGAPYRRILARGREGILSVEELDSFPVDGVKVWVKLDLAMRGKDGQVVIVDWKTGQHHAKEDVSLQLGIYGLYGTRAWEVAPEQIVAFDVNLRDGARSTHPIDAGVLTMVEAYIEDSIGQMRALLDDVDANAASIDRFALTEELWRCRRCPYRRACGREGV